MNIELLKKAGINVDDALVRFSGNQDLFEKYLLRFLDEPSYTSVVESIDAKDWALAEDSVHSFKGITGSLSMTALFQTSCDLLAHLRAKNYDEALDLYENLQKEYDEMKNNIKKANN